MNVTVSNRLVDYFCVLQYDEQHSRFGSSQGTVTQRFPTDDWQDAPFPNSLAMFCQPQGWSLSAQYRAPAFFSTALTDLHGARQYAYCLQVREPAEADPECEGGQLVRPLVYVLLSRHTYFDLFRACLTRVLSALRAGGGAEEMIGTLLAVRLHDTEPVMFTLGTDRLSVRALSQPTVPASGDRVAAFAKRLGSIHNLVLAVRALLSEQRVILHSAYLACLSDACNALTALMYPFEYSYTLVPVLPEMLIEYLESPTPYLMGVLASAADKVPTVDAVKIDLDTGLIDIPAGSSVPDFPEPFNSRLVASLQLVLSPGVLHTDDACPPALPPPADAHVLDKRIRACFLRTAAELLFGYRGCLELVRLHHNPLIVFQKAAFLGIRRLIGHPLLNQLLDSQMAQLFVSSRGLPYRHCDVFDQLVCSISDTIRSEEQQTEDRQTNIEQLAQLLLLNERQDAILSTVPIALRKDSLVRLPVIDSEALSSRLSPPTPCGVLAPGPPLLVPIKLQLPEEHLAGAARRLQLLSSCLQAIFDNRLSEARRMLSAVELSLRAVSVRVALCHHLEEYPVPLHKGTLQPQQFELVVQLMNVALDHESEEDEHGVAYACLNLSNIYCRSLSCGVHQFAFTCIQEHPVWARQRFWEAAFFHDVHRQLRRQYLRGEESGSKSSYDMWNLLEEPSAMALAADRLQRLDTIDKDELDKCAAEEESIVHGQAKHYINLMVYLRVPLDASRLRRIDRNDLESGHHDTAMDVDSANSEAESGFIENVNDGDLGSVVVKWISRLIDRICSAAGLDQKLTDMLIQSIPGFVAVHIDNLEQVYVESKRIAPIPKSKLLHPVLYTPSEKILIQPLRVFLLPDGKPGRINPERRLLPAEGALYLTNYRLIFKGHPCNPFQNDEVVIRSIPIMSLDKEKAISEAQLHSSGQLEGISARVAVGLHDSIQLRTAAFQLLHLAFDDEVTSDQLDEFSRMLTSLRWPAVLPHSLFAYHSAAHLLAATLPAGTTAKSSTLRQLRKTMGRLPIKGSLGRKLHGDSAQHMLPPAPPRPLIHTTGRADSLNNTQHSDYLDLKEASSLPDMSSTHSHYQSDWQRLRFGGDDGLVRISHHNETYMVARSYPSTLVVPSNVSDDTFVKVAKGFKQGRFPVITWISAGGAMLVRGAGLNSQNVVSKIKKQSAQMLAQDSHHSVAHGSQLSLASKHSSTSGLSNSAEYQEHYLLRLAQCSPTSASLQHDPHMSDSVSSVISIDSIFTADGVSLSTPEMPRKTTTAGPLDRAKTSSAFLRTGSSRMSVPSITLSDKSRDDVVSTAHWQQSMQQLERKNMYILGEKGQLKTLRVDKQVELIPVTYPSTHQIKVSFKKLLRVMQPGYAHHENTAANFHRLLDDTEWFGMVSSLLSLSNSVAQLMQLHNSTVVLCLEDGWDATCQISSIVQLLLDPYYRTLEGFQVLVEKEWLAFGHRFSYRANHTIGSQHSGVAPVFLLFLDAVHQLLHQFPSCFEFSHFYLRFLAFHSQAAFFRTFILDSEQERVRLDSLASDAPATPHLTSIWHFINERSVKTPLFHNLLYNKTEEVLSVVSCPAALQLWQFYSEDRTAHGSPYDIEVAELELQQREEERRARRENSTEWRQTRTQMDDTVCECVRDMCGEGRMERMVQEMQQLSEPVDWHTIWTQAAHKLDAQTNRCEDILPAWDRRQQKAVNRRAAIRLLMRGVASNASLRQSKSTGHNFAYHSSSEEEKCAQCRLSLFGTVIKTGWKCRNCGVMVHEKCMQYVLTACRPTPDALRGSTLTALQPAAPPRPPLPIGTIESQKSDTQTLLPASVCAPPARAIPSHQGWLNKKGATFKMWKPRWFVLDSNAHRLLYYDEPQSDAVRGVIDLCDVINVDVDMQQTHAFRKGTALLELRTTKRQYALMAESRHDADVWKEKIEATLRE